MTKVKAMMRKSLVALAMTVWASAPGFANAASLVDRPSGLAMTADVVLARPLLFVTTLVGTGLFVASLPFSAVGGNVGEAGTTLVATPFKATFMRCLGCSMKHMDDSDNY